LAQSQDEKNVRPAASATAFIAPRPQMLQRHDRACQQRYNCISPTFWQGPQPKDLAQRGNHRETVRRPDSSAQRRSKMAIRIGDEAPDFTAETTEGKIKFHDWIGDKWAILFSHPKDFTPVCTTELGYMAKLKPEFDKRNTKIIGLSVDPVSDHQAWVKDIQETQGAAVNYPMIGDSDLVVAKAYDMIHPNASGGKRTAADNATVRSVFIVGPDKKVKAMLIYPMSAGRNFDEVLRLLDSLQLNAKHTVATPVNWKPGEDVIIPTSVSDEDAKKKYPQGFKTHKPYLRTVAQPK
jgi:alkyl hydroperoxide reductase subunit AhpC